MSSSWKPGQKCPGPVHRRRRVHAPRPFQAGLPDRRGARFVATFNERTLLERLARGGKQARTLSEDTNALVKSILRNLQKILNARQGHAPAQLDFGIPAPSEITTNFPESIPMMQKIIRDSIEKYEPRLTSVNVVHVESEDDVLSLRFQITGKLSLGNAHSPVLFDTLVDGSGHIKLQG